MASLTGTNVREWQVARLAYSVMPAEAGIHGTLPRGCVCGDVPLIDTGVDGPLRGHDVVWVSVGAIHTMHVQNEGRFP